MKQSVWLLLLGLGMSACQTLRMNPTPMTATGGAELLVCSQWLALTYASKRDTPETVVEIRRANVRRSAYCKQ